MQSSSIKRVTGVQLYYMYIYIYIYIIYIYLYTNDPLSWDRSTALCTCVYGCTFFPLFRRVSAIAKEKGDNKKCNGKGENDEFRWFACRRRRSLFHPFGGRARRTVPEGRRKASQAIEPFLSRTFRVFKSRFKNQFSRSSTRVDTRFNKRFGNVNAFPVGLPVDSTQVGDRSRESYVQRQKAIGCR